MPTSSSSAAQEFLRTIEPRPAPANPLQPEAVLARLATLACSLTQADGPVLGMWRGTSDRTGQHAVRAAAGSGLPDGTLTLLLSPEGAHAALLWAPSRSDWSRLWVDGAEVQTPRADTGHSLALPPARWCSERFLSMPFVPENHPLQDWSGNLSGTGTQRGLLVWDAQAKALKVHEPGPTELWPDPWLELQGEHTLNVRANAAEPRAAPVRSLQV